jgi:glutamate-ammonia-ligase adenylyltransferase
LVTELAEIPDPDRALLAIERLLRQAPDPLRTSEVSLAGPRRLHNVLRVFGSSPYLTELVLARPELLGVLSELHRNAAPQSTAALEAALRARCFDWWLDAGTRPALDHEAVAAISSTLHDFQQEQLLRIGASDLLVLSDLPTITAQLSALATVLVRAALALARRAALDAVREDDASREDFGVLALGKLGGWELNYCSDIDLLFVARSDAPNAWPLARKLVDVLSGSSGPALLYRVDLRLRPWGRDGALVQSVSAQLGYLEQHARTSEQQALIKARVIAGDEGLGRELLAGAQDRIFRVWEPELLRRDVFALKARIEAELRRDGVEWGQVKTGEGSIRDVEFVTQYLQLRFAHLHPEDPGMRSGNTLDALRALVQHGRLPEDDYRSLVGGYVFLRTVEHDLQLVSNRPAHRLPTDARRLEHLARRLGFAGAGGVERFLHRLDQHNETVRHVFDRHLGESGPPVQIAVSPGGNRIDTLLMPAPYQRAFDDDTRARHLRMAEQLRSGRTVVVSIDELGDRRCRLELVGYDALGSLSVLCGLLYAYGFNILDGQVFTAEDATETATDRRTIVDVFTLEPRSDLGTDPEPLARRISGLRSDLEDAFGQLASGAHTEVQAAVANRVALRLASGPGRSGLATPPLYPVDIRVDNEASERSTVLHIEGLDTAGFLYELTNALALAEINIELMQVRSSGARVRDTLWVTDKNGRKLVDPDQLERVRLTTVLTKHFTHLLPRAPDAAKALLAFRQFLGDLFSRPDWHKDIASLERPAVLDSLARLLGVSDFLWQDLLRMQHESLFPLLRDVEDLASARARRELQNLLGDELGAASENQVEALNRFKDREQFRIDMRRILGYAETFEQFSLELTELAEVVCGEAVRLAYQDLVARHGEPYDDGGQRVPHALFGLGKFGGRELGFASDLELLLVYGGNGRCRPVHGPAAEARHASELFARTVEGLKRNLQARHEGTFAIDLRLRPYGDGGPLAVSATAFADYFAPEGDAWPYERQGLVKLRFVAGDRRLGKKIEGLRDRLAYRGPPLQLAAVRALRERQIRHLVKPGSLNAKFSPGCLVDVEYLVQLLQLRHGRRQGAVRTTNTLFAVRALHELGALDAHDVERLAGAYRFLRGLIDGLRMVHGHARDLTVPAQDSEAFRFLARRLDLPPERLARQLEHHTATVPRLYEELLVKLEK